MLRHDMSVKLTRPSKRRKLVYPLPIPERPWQCLSMNFISGFLKVEDFGSILVVVDNFFKYVVFIPTLSKCPVEEVARIFFSNVVKHFGLPEDIVNDRDTRFTGRFWFNCSRYGVRSTSSLLLIILIPTVKLSE